MQILHSNTVNLEYLIFSNKRNKNKIKILSKVRVPANTSLELLLGEAGHLWGIYKTLNKDNHFVMSISSTKKNTKINLIMELQQKEGLATQKTPHLQNPRGQEQLLFNFNARQAFFNPNSTTNNTTQTEPNPLKRPGTNLEADNAKIRKGM